jgi:hypothetical protein
MIPGAPNYAFEDSMHMSRIATKKVQSARVAWIDEDMLSRGTFDTHVFLDWWEYNSSAVWFKTGSNSERYRDMFEHFVSWSAAGATAKDVHARYVETRLGLKPPSETSASAPGQKNQKGYYGKCRSRGKPGGEPPFGQDSDVGPGWSLAQEVGRPCMPVGVCVLQRAAVDHATKNLWPEEDSGEWPNIYEALATIFRKVELVEPIFALAETARKGFTVVNHKGHEVQVTQLRCLFYGLLKKYQMRIKPTQAPELASIDDPVGLWKRTFAAKRETFGKDFLAFQNHHAGDELVPEECRKRKAEQL